MTGSNGKGFAVMLVGGVLAWNSWMSWSQGRDGGEEFGLLMAVGTLAVLAAPAQLVAGRNGNPLLLAAAGGVGATVPWFFTLAVRQEGQGVLGPALLVLVSSCGLCFAVCWVTRYLVRRWSQL